MLFFTRLHLGYATLAACLLSAGVEASPIPWAKLAPLQQEALSPLASQWNNLPDPYQADMLKLANHYDKLTPEQKTRLHNRLLDWSRLTPQQRVQARQKYTAFQKVPPEKREMVKSMVKEQQATRTPPQPVSAPTPATAKQP